MKLDSTKSQNLNIRFHRLPMQIIYAKNQDVQKFDRYLIYEYKNDQNKT